MRSEGFVVKTYNYPDRSGWRFTEAGMSILKGLVKLVNRKAVFKCHRTDQDYETFTVFELWDMMIAKGWDFEVVAGKRAARAAGLVPYSKDGVQKLCVRTSVEKLPFWCMMVLLDFTMLLPVL